MSPIVRLVKARVWLDFAESAADIALMSHAIELPQEVSPKRRAMIDAAERLFLQHGYEAASMDAVAREAGVSKATLYAHFISKDALFATIVGERGMMQRFEDADFPAETQDLRASLIRVGHVWLEFMTRPRTLAIYRIAVAESARFPELGQAFYVNGPCRTALRFANWLVGFRERGLIEAADLDVAARQFFGLLKGSMFMRATLAVAPAPDATEIATGVGEAVETWLRAFGRRAGPPAPVRLKASAAAG